MEELWQSLLLTTMELEKTRLMAQEELKMRDDQLDQLKDILNRTIKERDEAQDKYRRLFEELLFQQQQQQYQQTDPTTGISSIEDAPIKGIDSKNGLSSSDCDESIVSSPTADPITPPAEQEACIPLVLTRPLPEKGKLLQAVMKAGPLLRTLPLAGPLPQWCHPPPPLDSDQIPTPPIVIPSPPTQIHNCSAPNRKRGLCAPCDSTSEKKYQRIILH